ncbi:hypothetical protein V8B55DRAFT_1541309 [Mucor lusitanicus]|uniref:Uncharacterized protein n=2 Tax=Mucor circinelloides f. lusitanicus TaxID=29924 RepID=A0A168NE50_MUCCL|nr:hypothetical protein FB192DRAFT_1388375 [Mucor lusitanicus]OAD06156.1 hypothetical protein MUCCIDRAFT_106722 [Mucor lusitanicus CBS 277.49]
MLENFEQKRSVKFKSIFRQQVDTNQSNFSRKSAAHLEISPPILQHSTSIFSLVSPTRTAFQTFYNDKNQNEIPYELYQPLSPPPPVPRQRSPYSTTTSAANSVSPCPHRQLSNATANKQNFERPMHPLEVSQRQQQQNDRPINNPMRHVDARRTLASDPRVIAGSPEKKKSNRRHSCSSTMYKAVEKEANNNGSSKSLLRKGRRSSKVGTWSPSAASIEPSVSKSTPHKVKTYNVPKKTEDIEKERKMQELEDLITGRRGSTLKLSLTPKGLS